MQELKFNLFMLFLTLYLLISFIISIFGDKSTPKDVRQRFGFAAFLTGCATIFEFIENNMQTHSTTFAAAIEFSLVPYILYVLTMAINENQKTKISRTIFAIVISNTFLEIMNQFFGFLFYFDENYTYHRGIFAFVYFVVNGICMCLCLLQLHLKVHSTEQSIAKYKTLHIFLQMLICTFFQAWTTNLVVVKFGIALSIQQFYILYKLSASKIDGLTSLMSQKIWNLEIENLKKKTKAKALAFVIFDVGNFKHINDTYGHEFGDECLIRVAALIKKHFAKHGLCFRKGGDEFAVIFRGKNISELIEPGTSDNNPNNKKATMLIKDIINDFYTDLEYQIINQKLNESFPEFPWVDIGFAFNVDSNPIDIVLDVADKQMYSNKKKRKSAAR